ncbi:MAG: phosphatidylserine decarboxylase, partial [Clostridia bacterium]|nr:phosphatidylserine decarboxylase [Clostridia bacterium]
IGALLVGKIVLSHPGSGRVSRGEEAGYFRFGGSTVVLLLPAGSARLDGDIIKASEEGKEISVRFGERIGRSLKDVSL